MATQKQVKNFFATLGPLVQKVCKERGYGNASLWTCMAQAACESGYGTSKLMAGANAYFGIKASKSWVNSGKYGGKVYNSKTSECYDGKTYTSITACFRAYNTMEDSIRDYFDLIECKRYKESLTKTTVLDAITVIKNGGYATSPTYINTITSIYNTYKSQIECYRVENETTQAPTTSTTKRPIEEVAKDVINGLYGNGEDRKAKLQSEGYDYKEVQTLVNQMVKGTNTPQQSTNETNTYTVKKGDSLWKIAANELGKGSRYSEIMKLNGLTTTIIRVGQTLKLPSK